MSPSLDIGREGPLAGLKVVEFAQMIAAPSAGLLLGDYGADVIKVEPPGGDGCRQLQSAVSRELGVTPIFTAYNRNKTLVTLDLTTDEGKRAAADLLRDADVMIESSRPGAMDRLGLGVETVLRRYPSLIYASVSGFGNGPVGRALGGVDIVVQAESGMMSLTGQAGGPPTKIGFTAIDAACGHALCHGILAALIRRGRTGRGEHVEVSLYDLALHLQTGPIAEYLASGVQPRRTGNSSPLAAPADLFQCGEGQIIISAYLDAHWRRFAALIGAPEMTQDPRFDTSTHRVANRDALLAVIERQLAVRSAAEWTALFRENGLLAGEVKTYAQVMEDPVAIESAMILDAPRGPGVANPVRIRSWTGGVAGSGNDAQAVVSAERMRGLER